MVMTANREEQEATMGRFFTNPTPRVQRLRAAFLDIPPCDNIPGIKLRKHWRRVPRFFGRFASSEGHRANASRII